MAEFLESRQINVYVLAAGPASKAYILPPVGVTWKVKAIRYVARITSANNATNYVSIRPYAGSTALAAARTTASTDLTQGTVETATITASGAQLEVTSSNPFLMDVSQAASGVAANVEVFVDFEIVRVNA